jgi:RNA polymerase sigma-70 factor (ECF subfamily)
MGEMGMGERDERAIFAPAAPAAPKSTELDAAGAKPIDGAMDRYARGEDAALDELYRLGAHRVRSFLARLCANLSLADDLTQDAFLRIHSARGQFVAGAPAMPWMFAIARNSYRDYLRREQVRREHRSTTALLAVSERLDRPASGGDRALIAQQMLDVVQRALMGLPVRQREAFVLMRFEGLNLVEAARVLGTTEAATKILVHRAYVVVRAALERQNRADGDAGRASPR